MEDKNDCTIYASGASVLARALVYEVKRDNPHGDQCGATSPHIDVPVYVGSHSCPGIQQLVA